MYCQERTGLKHINVSHMVKEHELHEGMDDKFDTLMLDEDKVILII